MEKTYLEELYYMENDGSRYQGLAFDGSQFYLTKQNKIYIFNEVMQKICCIETCKCYTSICHDCCLGGFWALAANDPQHVYRLNSDLKEIDCIGLCGLHDAPTGISCGEKTDELLIAAGEWIYRTAKYGSDAPIQMKKIPGAMGVRVASSGSGYLCSGIVRQMCSIWHYASSGYKQTIVLPKDYHVVDMAPGHGCTEAYLLVTKDFCYQRIMKCCFDSRSFCDSCCKPPECGCDSCCKPPECGCDSCCKPPECGCDSCCKPPGCGCDPCYEPCDTKCCGELCDIIESVALVETALSHILNAEGEKLQKMLEISCEPCEIMNVNKSINETITNVTQLECVLFQKLHLAESMREENCDPPCDCE